MITQEPPNRLQSLLAKRRTRRAVFFLSWIIAIAASTILSPHTFAAVLYENTIGGADFQAPDGTTGLNTSTNFKLGTGLTGTMTSFYVTNKRSGSDSSGNIMKLQILCFADATYTTSISACSYNYFTFGPNTYADGTFGTCDSIATGSSGGAYAERSCTNFQTFTFDPSRYYVLRLQGGGSAADMFVETNPGGTLPVYRIEGENDIELLNLSGTGEILPFDPVTLQLRWNGVFAYPDFMTYAWFFPYNQVEGCYGAIGELCAEAVYTPIPVTNNATGSGTLTFTYPYAKNGSFTGAMLISNDPYCDLNKIYLDSACDDNIFIERAEVNIGSYRALSMTDPKIANTVFSNGGGGSGAYLVTNKQTYYTGEPVYLKWKADLGGLTISSIKIYTGSGTDVAATLTSAADLDVDNFHAAQIHYSQSGQYQPFIRACVGDCSTTWQDIYIGGGTAPDFERVLTVIDREVDDGVEEGVIPGVGIIDDSSGTGSTCSTRGVFGLQAASFYVAFASDGNVFYKGIQVLLNKAVDAVMWISGNVMCVFEAAPLISNVADVVAPAAGTYQLPTEIFHVEIDPMEVFGASSYVVAYNTDTETGKLGQVLSGGLFAWLTALFILKGIFGRRRSHS